MKPILLIDFGSTYTKVTAVDADAAKLLGSAAAYTTVQTDINDGLANAVALLSEQTGKLEFAERYACSSAAGGLRMIASGLVPELTAEAAKCASLGAGAKVINPNLRRATGPWVCKNCIRCGSSSAPGFAEPTPPVRFSPQWTHPAFPQGKVVQWEHWTG